MVCIYCGGDTKVTNSRPNHTVNQIWRRRQCLVCRAVFTSYETADLAEAFRFRDKDGLLQPFQRSRLFVSLYESCRHRPTAVEDAEALTQTVVSRLPGGGTVERHLLIESVQAVLQAFDQAAASYYNAYYAKR